jgi:putative transposase
MKPCANEVWSRDRQRDPPAPAAGRRQMAPRRDGHHHRGQEALPVARQDGFVLEALVQSRRGALANAIGGTRRRPSAWLAQAPEKARPGAAGDGDRQAEVLRGGEKGDHARRRAPPAQGAQQPGRELPPADTTTRTADEAVQVGPPRSALRLDPLANLFHLRRVTASQYRAARSQTFEDWAEIAGARLAA